MTVNDKPGKTEIMVHYAGVGSRNAFQKGHVQHITDITVQHQSYGTLKVAIVDHYKHLGSVNAGPYRLEYEAHMRAGNCRSAFTSLSRKLFRNKGLPEKLRLYFWKALCMSKLFSPW